MTLGYMAGALSDAPEVWTARTLPGQTAMEASPRLRDQALLSDDFKPFRDKGFVVTLDRSLTERRALPAGDPEQRECEPMKQQRFSQGQGLWAGKTTLMVRP